MNGVERVPALEVGMTTTRLRNVVFVCIVVGVVSVLAASFWDYPGWMWLPLFLGIIVPVAVGGVALIVLLGKLLTDRGSAR